MYPDAIKTYQAITKNGNFSNSARLKMNIGNIYVKMGDLPQAIKMYRMALDQTNTAQKYLRYLFVIYQFNEFPMKHKI